MLCLSGFKLYSRWVPLRHVSLIGKILIRVKRFYQTICFGYTNLQEVENFYRGYKSFELGSFNWLY